MDFKYYEVHSPYYALIKARDEDEAYQVYVNTVADDEDDELMDEIKEVSANYAIAYFSRRAEELEIHQLLEILESDEPEQLLVDSYFL